MVELQHSSGTRREDLRLDVEQIAADKALIIRSADQALEQEIYMAPEELEGKDLRMILPQNIQDQINSFLEFEEDGPDLSSVLAKVRDFRLLHKKGREVRFSLKILRDVSTSDAPHFQLHLSRLNIIDSLSDQLDLGTVGQQDVLDGLTGLPNRASFLRHLEVVQKAVAAGKVNACLALLRVDQFNTVSHAQGETSAKQMFQHLCNVLAANLREDDSAGYVEPNRVAILLLEAGKEHAKVPLNRIRWMFSAKPLELEKETITPTLTATYIELDGKGTADAQIEACQSRLREAEADAGNTILAP